MNFWFDLKLFLAFIALSGAWLIYESYKNEIKAKKMNKKDENDSV